LKIYSELEDDPVDILSKNELTSFMDTVANQAYKYFKIGSDKWLIEESIVKSKYTNLDIINMQIRHIQYHLGCFECYLRDNNYKTQSWID
jgi:hypothetical protein